MLWIAQVLHFYTRHTYSACNLSLDLLSLRAAYAVVLTWEPISAQLSVD